MKVNSERKGLLGWMFFVIVLMFGMALGRVYSVYINFILGDYLFMIPQVILLLLFSYSLVLIFQRKKQAPDMIIYSLLAFFIFRTIFYILVEDYFGFLGMAVFFILLIIYLKSSKRVKNTFIK